MQKNEAGYSNSSWDINSQKSSLTRVASKSATSHTGQLQENKVTFKT